jgi:homoserine dehydrogenase
VRELARCRTIKLPAGVLTQQVDELLTDPSIEVVVEVTGRLEEAKVWLEKALQAGKHVVTANKSLLARHLVELQELARQRDRTLGYEAAVVGGIPLLRAIREGLVVYGISEIVGVLNGTTHYILSRMSVEHLSFQAALAEAQRLGFAEPDPSDDVSGRDAACKLAILAQTALALPVTLREIYFEGINSVLPVDLQLASKLGFRIKPVAVARRAAVEGKWELRVHPALVPAATPMGRLELEENGIHVSTEQRGDYFFSGRGAGGAPTAGAVMSDLLEVALRPGGCPRVSLADVAFTVPPEQFVTGHYLRVAGDVSAVRRTLDSRDIRVLASVQQGDETALVTSRGTSASVLSPLASSGAEPPRAWLRVEGELPS